jgi:hypothetical protein
LDSEGDTLAYIQKLKGDIGLFSFFGKKLRIDKLKLSGATINLVETQDGKYNFDHIISHLNSEDDTSEASDSNSWTISLASLDLKNTNFNYTSNGSTITTLLPELSGDFSTFSLDDSIFEMSSLDIKGIMLTYNALGTNQKVDSPTQFPSLPFLLKINNLSVKSDSISYHTSSEINQSNKFDPNHILIKSLDFSAQDFIWKDSLRFDLDEMHVKMKDGFELSNLSTNLFLSNQKLILEKTRIETLSSSVNMEGSLVYNNLNQLVKDILNTNSTLYFDNATLSREDIDYFVNYDKYPNINFVALDDITIDGKVFLKENQIITQDISIKSGNQFALKGSTNSSNLSSAKLSSHSFDISHFSTSQNFINRLLPSIKWPEELNNLGFLTGILKGRANSNKIDFNSISIHSNKGTSISGYGEIYDLQGSEGPAVDFYFKKLKTNINTLLSEKANIPEELKRLEDIVYIGQLKGNLRNVKSNGTLFTSLGNLELDANTKFNNDFSDANYSGIFNLQDFDLGHMLSDTMLGIANFEGNITGSGLSLEDIKAKVDGSVKSFCYDGYIYHDIIIDGSYQDSLFDGRIISKDENLSLDIEGKVDFRGPTSSMDVTMNMRNLDLKELGFAKDDMKIGGIFKGQVRGKSIDDFVGNGTITDFSVTTEKGNYFADSTVVIRVAELNQNAKSFYLDSPFFEGEIKGKIKPSSLIRFVKNYIKAYIPLEIGYDEDDNDKLARYFAENEDQNFIFSAKTKDINPFLAPFFGEDISINEASLGAYFSSEDTRLDIKGKIDSLLYKGVLFQRGSYFFDGRKSFINGNINLEDISMDNEILVPITTINTVLNNKVANFKMVLSNEDDVERLNLGGDLTRTDEYIVTFEDSIYLSGSQWEFSPYNQIIFGDYGLYMQDVKLSKGKQAITLYTDENENGEAIEVLFDNFILSEMTSIIDKKNEFIEGKIDGALLINSLYSKPFITANLDVKNLTITGNQAGTLSIQAAQNVASNSVNSTIRLLGAHNDATMKLNYGIENQTTVGEFDVQKLEMGVIDPYLTDIFIESEGYVTGKIKINGDLNNLDLEGKLRTHNVKTTPVFTNSRYEVIDSDVSFSDKEIDFNTIELRDKNANSAFVTGKIYHENLRNSVVDLKVSSKEFEFLNTSSDENELFFGNVNISGNASIYGPIDDIKIEGLVSAVNNSKLSVSPFSIESELRSDDFIIYSGDPRKIPFDSLKIEVKKPKLALPFDIELTLNVDNDSEFSMILNPITGDKLTCNGTSNLILKLNKEGVMELFGTYTVTEGVYTFSYGIISKEFNIQPGSTVTFNGDPLNGILDLDAIYIANTSVYDLIKLESDLSDTQKSEAQRNRDINVVLSLSNSILKPTIKLDLTADDNDLSSISDVLTRKFSQLRAEPDELNNQVFGLLLFNNFILVRNAETDLAKTGTDIAIQSISGLITSELNKLADGLLKGFEVNFDFNSYSSDFLEQGQQGFITELGLGVKQKLVDDRLTISAGTNINLESTSKASSFTTIAGDFALEYKLNKDGSYIIKAFRKSSFDRLVDENSSKNGASFFVRKEFGTIKKKKD